MRALDLRSRAANLREIAAHLPTVEVVKLLEIYARDLSDDAARIDRRNAALVAYHRVGAFQ
jgi:hypothetical protein